jgi:hypothetical protein
MNEFPAMFESTLRTLKFRSRGYRVLVIATLLVIVIALAGSAVRGSPHYLVLLLLLVPCCTLFFAADTLLVGRWQDRLLEAWLDSRIDIQSFKSALRAHPWLPNTTVESMLHALPDTDRADQSPIDSGQVAEQFRHRLRLQSCRAVGIAIVSVLLTVSTIAFVIL